MKISLQTVTHTYVIIKTRISFAKHPLIQVLEFNDGGGLQIARIELLITW